MKNVIVTHNSAYGRVAAGLDTFRCPSCQTAGYPGGHVCEGLRLGLVLRGLTAGGVVSRCSAAILALKARPLPIGDRDAQGEAKKGSNA